MKKLIVSPSPHIHSADSTRKIMRDVLIAMAPAFLVSVWFFGMSVIMLALVGVLACVLTEWLITKFLMKRKSTVSDLSAAVTGVLLALNLPPNSPWWLIAVGAVFSIGVVKMSFGGLGQNIFNPAIAGRVFLLISFPTLMTDWSLPDFWLRASGAGVDAVSGATPLAIVKEGLAGGMTMDEIFAANGFTYTEMLFARIGGSVGEVSAVALIIGFIYLLARKVVKPHIPLAIICTIFIFSGIFWLIDPQHYTDPVFNILTGGVLLGSFFMATDYATSPMGKTAMVIYGVGIGLITVIIRYFGSYPEGISFAILIMNSVVPLLNKYVKPRKFGR